MKPNEYGWDTQKGVKNQDTVVGDKEIPLTESEYGMAAKAIGQGDGYSKFQLGYEGYVVNANKLNVAKEIYFDIEVDSACDTDWAQSGGAAKWISFGLFNSLNGALTSQGPETNRGLNGGLALFAFNLTENTTQISGWPTGKTPVRPVANAFTYNNTVKLDMMHFVIVIGETKAESGLYLEKDGNRTLIANLDLQRSMFPDGAYLMLSCFRKTDFTVRLAQQSSIKAGSQENGTYSFSKTSGIAGEKVYIENIAPKAGYKFTERSVFAGDTALSLETEEVGGEVKYYFSMPVGDEVVIEIKWAVAVTFVADDQTLGTAYVVPGDKVLGVDMPDDPEKAGHTFDGWYKDAAFTQAFDRKTDAIEGLTTIYAKISRQTFIRSLSCRITRRIRRARRITAGSLPRRRYPGKATPSAAGLPTRPARRLTISRRPLRAISPSMRSGPLSAEERAPRLKTALRGTARALPKVRRAAEVRPESAE